MKIKHLFFAGLTGTLVIQMAVADQLWVQRYDGTGQGDNEAYATAVDRSGNVVVTGGSMNAAGDRDFYTVKYSPSGSVIWSKRYDSGGGDDVATSVAVDSVGNVVVTGHTVNPPNSINVYGETYTAMYAAADGSILWEKHGPTGGVIYYPTLNDPREADRVVVDNADNVILAVSDIAGLIPTPFYIAKYAGTSGALIWEEFDWVPGDAGWITDLKLDGAGNAIVTGTTLVYNPYPAADPDFYTAKYDAATGRRLWYQTYDSPFHGSDYSTGVAVDSLGNVVVVGGSTDYTAPNYNLAAYYHVAKYAAADGNVLWENQYQTPVWIQPGYAGIFVAVDSDGNVFISGASPPNLGNPLAYSFAAKYAATDGQLLWLKPYQSPCSPGGDYPYGIAATSAGDLIVTGWGYDGDPVGYPHYHTVKYAGADGQVLWQQNYIGPGNPGHRFDTPQALAIDKSGNVIVTGGSQNALGFYDYLTVKYEPSGTSGTNTINCPTNIIVGADPGQCSAVVTFPTPSATDACGNSLSVTCSPASGSVFQVGTTTVTCTASDGSTCSFTVTVKDTEKPVITGPASLTVHATSINGAVVTFTPTATDNCPGVNVTSSPASGTLFPPGATTVMVTATDASGNTASQIFTVTVLADVVLNGPLTVNAGTIKGSVQLLAGKAVTLNSGASITGDLLVPGTPNLVKNGQSSIQGTIVGAGNTQPSGFPVTLSGNSSLRDLRTRINPITMPAVPTPPAPAGTRTVALNSAGQSPGDFSTLRNLTLNGNAGIVTIPPGTYGNFTANGSSGFVLGTAGSDQPALYNLQSLTLNGTAQVVVVGPVILVLANSLVANGTTGSSSQPDWLQLMIASGGVTLNSGATLSALVTAPTGVVTINGNSMLVGAVQCNQLTINSGGLLQGVGN